MLVSIHLTTFCQAASGWLERAIASVLEQTYADFELICYDDGSYDGTAQLLARFASEDRRVRVITGSPNLNSVAKSLGRCFLARSPEAGAITWMFDDNILAPDALQTLVSAMERTGADVVYGQTRIMTVDGSSWLIGTREPEVIGASFQATSADVPNAGILIRPEVFERSGWYDSSIILRRSCDWDLFRRIWSSGSTIVKVDHVCATEFGELSPSSLRNSFDTSFELMKRYVRLRDEIGFRLDVASATYGPADVVPEGPWSKDELSYIYHGFVRYFVSVGNLGKAAEWGNEIISLNGLDDDLVVKNLRRKFGDQPEILEAVVSGLFARRVADPAVSIVRYSFKREVAEYLQRRIRTAKSQAARVYWKVAFHVLRRVWRSLPR
ncbi:glycosyltransferase family 2 protein [Mesorhizobium sp. ZMM04-5]|uniref:Glycosyltransferase family 2 protein n=1 Tax=Mesorhizobium marinum TaxID=3228790 RepID=A0ABV3R122_9HYPH